jgi:hypothetical protein
LSLVCDKKIVQISALESRVIQGMYPSNFVWSFLTFPVATQYWTATNIADGLNALTICIEVKIRDVRFHSTHVIVDGDFLRIHDVGLWLR